MLHAAFSHKTRLPAHRYVSARQTNESRRTQEDEITSVVFGPLDFMATDSRRRLVAHLFGVPIADDSDVSLEFWPRWDGVEPDVVFIETAKNATRKAFVIEVKWNAPLGEDQVGRQIRAIEGLPGVTEVKHLVLSRQTYPVDSPSRNMTWMDFKERIKTITNDSVLVRWSTLVCEFLELCNVRHFLGFGSLPACDLSAYDKGSTIFWPGFDGWGNIECCGELPYSHDEPVFWNKLKGDRK